MLSDIEMSSIDTQVQAFKLQWPKIVLETNGAGVGVGMGVGTMLCAISITLFAITYVTKLFYQKYNLQLFYYVCDQLLSRQKQQKQQN